ncbi:Sphingoid long-chain base transporter RSB1 [Trichoderma lentiforme]|uniref:Sphingoid long-chain base transporter RSB1 n=1 Tax=Trichoderma lentiforme TaxID=1567552 RepID=A0A9P4XQV1_9HYPO|nr:Sphingoid long-chain base transporter RSB1 [Trichoderma lentiforme]
MASTCGSTCPTGDGFFANGLSLIGSAVFLAVFAFLTPTTFYLGYRFRTPGFSALMATGLAFEVFGFLGRILLHESRDHQGYFALTLLGSILGPVFMSGAMTSILPHLLVIYGQGHARCQPILTTSFLFGLFIVSLVLDIVGTVFVAYGYGGVSRDRSADIIAGGLGAQALLLFAIITVYVCFTTGLFLSDEAPDPTHADIYYSTQFSRFLRCMEVVSLLLFAQTIYRIFEMVGGLSGTLFQSEPAFMIMNGLVPFLACLLLTTAHPGAAFGSSWGATSPRYRKRRGLALPPLQTSFSHAVHHRYDPNIRSQFSPSTQRPLREAKPPPTYGSYGLPSSPRPVNRPPSPMILSPISVRAVSAQMLTERSERWAAPTDLVDSDVLW